MSKPSTPRLEALRLKLCSAGLSPTHYDTPEKAADAVCEMIANFRREFADPPHDLQCAVLGKLRVLGHIEESNLAPLYQLTPYSANWTSLGTGPVRECITHHHDCDCREQVFSRIKAALAALVEEYEDRKAQFGSDCLWQKHEVPGVLESAKRALEELN